MHKLVLEFQRKQNKWVEILNKAFFIFLLWTEQSIPDYCGLFPTAKERKMQLVLNWKVLKTWT